MVFKFSRDKIYHSNGFHPGTLNTAGLLSRSRSGHWFLGARGVYFALRLDQYKHGILWCKLRPSVPVCLCCVDCKRRWTPRWTAGSPSNGERPPVLHGEYYFGCVLMKPGRSICRCCCKIRRRSSFRSGQEPESESMMPGTRWQTDSHSIILQVLLVSEWSRIMSKWFGK